MKRGDCAALMSVRNDVETTGRKEERERKRMPEATRGEGVRREEENTLKDAQVYFFRQIYGTSI